MSSAGLAPQPSYGSHPFGFEKEYWLSAKVPLTDATPIATVNRFCIDHGFYMWELGGSTAHEQRRALYKLLEKHRWPEGLDGFMAAMKAPRASKPALNTAAPTMPHSARGATASRPMTAQEEYAAMGMSAPAGAYGAPPGVYASPYAPPMGAASVGDHSSEALMQMLQHQTSMTQKWQAMLAEQNASSTDLQQLTESTAALVRDQSETTRRMLQAPPARPLA